MYSIYTPSALCLHDYLQINNTTTRGKRRKTEGRKNNNGRQHKQSDELSVLPPIIVCCASRCHSACKHMACNCVVHGVHINTATPPFRADKCSCVQTRVQIKTELKFRIQQVRAESPMEHIAQGKRSDTLGYPHSRIYAPCKGKSFTPLCCYSY